MQRTKAFAVWIVTSLVASAAIAGDASGSMDFWASRDVTIEASEGTRPVRIGIWDSGVDLSLFSGKIALDEAARPLVRGYDSFKLRQDTPLAILREGMKERSSELNQALMAFDDIDSGVKSAAAERMNAKLDAMSKAQQVALSEEVGAWSGYAHGTNVADISLRGNGRAQIVVARMEWWHGSPPVPCWTRELADREAASMHDLLDFLAKSGARVVNMSWGRFQSSYVHNLEDCAPQMPAEERLALARYTVEKIRGVLTEGMAAAPNTLFVGAAGNEGSSVKASNPATRISLPNFLLVGAVDSSGKVAPYTNTGPEVTLYANGYRVPARLPGGQVSFPSGTSMATPNVSNAAAKMLAINPRLTGAGVRRLLEQTATKNATGQSLLHARRAVAAARAISRHNHRPALP